MPSHSFREPRDRPVHRQSFVVFVRHAADTPRDHTGVASFLSSDLCAECTFATFLVPPPGRAPIGVPWQSWSLSALAAGPMFASIIFGADAVHPKARASFADVVAVCRDRSCCSHGHGRVLRVLLHGLVSLWRDCAGTLPLSLDTRGTLSQRPFTACVQGRAGATRRRPTHPRRPASCGSSSCTAFSLQVVSGTSAYRTRTLPRRLLRAWWRRASTVSI